MIKQVILRDNVNNVVVGGIMLESGNMICAHCGQFIHKKFIGDFGTSNKPFTHLETWETWVDLSEKIRKCETWQRAEELYRS